MRSTATTTTIAAAVLLRACVSLHGYSGEGVPPMYGDFEAQRHWMEVTVNLPAERWYVHGPDNDLQYWGLDYPPLSAHFSWAVGRLAQAWHPQLVFAEARRACGEERAATVRGGAGRRAAACWRDACPRRAPRWRGCAAASACPVRFAAKPVVLVRHPLRTVESLVAGFCRGDARFAADSAGEPPNQLKAAARLLAGLDEAALGRESCALGFARYWRAYYAALEPLVAAGAALVRAEDDDYACAIVAAVAARA